MSEPVATYINDTDKPVAVQVFTHPELGEVMRKVENVWIIPPKSTRVLTKENKSA